MTFFFDIAAKELAEAALKKRGALRGMKGVLPMMACAGGVIGPAIVYRLICTRDMVRAWAVPCATDIAFAWLGARAIWGCNHPAVTFLLALAVADDFVGLGIIAIFYPQREFNVGGLLLLTLGVTLALGCNRAEKPFPALGRWRDVPLIGLLGATGFTVALFVAEAVGGHASLKLGALASFVFLGLAVVLENLPTVRRK